LSLKRRVAVEVALVLATLAIGLAVAAIVAAGFHAPAARVLGEMFVSWRSLPDVVAEYTAMLALTGAAFALPVYAGLFNIGAEGSFQLGALVALWAAIKWGGISAPLLLALAAGAALSGLAGWLRARLSVNEVLSTIMLNWIIYWILLYLVVTKLEDPYNPQRTLEVPQSSRLPWLHVDGAMIPSTLVVAIAVLAILWFLVRMTRWGLTLRFAGANEWTTKTRGVNVGLYRIASMALAGMVAGLAGGLHILGYSHSIDVIGGAVRGFGYNGIGVALMGRNDLLAVIPAAALFATLLTGSSLVEPVYGVPKEAGDFIVGVIVILLAAPEAIRLAGRALGGVRGWRH
jgi:ABC-type uncharacterized transport system permease subunit